MAGEMIQELCETLMPELESGRENFREPAAKAMPAWDNHVLAIEADASGRPGIKRYNVSEVDEELRDFAARAEQQLRAVEKGKASGKRTRTKLPPSFRKQR